MDVALRVLCLIFRLNHATRHLQMDVGLGKPRNASLANGCRAWGLGFRVNHATRHLQMDVGLGVSGLG